MDNTVIPYQDESDSSENDIDESSSEDEHSQLLSNNIGVLYNKFNTGDDQFMNMESKLEYLKSRNELFTPEISKIRILVDSKNITHTTTSHDTSNYTVQLKQSLQIHFTELMLIIILLILCMMVRQNKPH